MKCPARLTGGVAAPHIALHPRPAHAAARALTLSEIGNHRIGISLCRRYSAAGAGSHPPGDVRQVTHERTIADHSSGIRRAQGLSHLNDAFSPTDDALMNIDAAAAAVDANDNGVCFDASFVFHRRRHHLLRI